MGDFIYGALSNVGSFLNRNRGKVLLTTTAIAIGLTIYWQYTANETSDNTSNNEEERNAISNSMDEIKNRKNLNETDKKNRIRILMSIQKQFDIAARHFLPSLRLKIVEMIDINSTIKKLKQMRQKAENGNTNNYNEITLSSNGNSNHNVGKNDNTSDNINQEDALWEEVKISSFAMLYLTAYMLAFICTLLKIQLHLLAKLIFQTSQSQTKISSFNDKNPSSSLGINNDNFRLLIEGTYQQLFGAGLSTFSELISHKIRSLLSQWQVKDKLSVQYSGLLEVLILLRKSFEDDFTTIIKDIFIPPVEADDVKVEDQLNAQVTKILNQTWDIVESPIFAIVLSETIENTFKVIFETLKMNAFTKDSKSDIKSIPLASLLPQLKLISSKLLPSDSMSEFIPHIMNGPHLDAFCIALFDNLNENNFTIV
eukprot:gene11035-14817_t